MVYYTNFSKGSVGMVFPLLLDSKGDPAALFKQL